MASSKSPKFEWRTAAKYTMLMVRKGCRQAVSLIPRFYSLAILYLVCWLTYRAVRYLVVSLVVPAAVPGQIAGLPTRMTESILRTERSAFPALESTATPRTPLSHYHRLNGWIDPDTVNDCTRSGCHAPLPHTRRKEVRAFLNMHATSLHCGVCHMQVESQPVKLVWYDQRTGDPRPAPALLRAYDLLTSDRHRAAYEHPDVDFQSRLAGLLRDATKDADESQALTDLTQHIEAIRPTNPEFLRILDLARVTLPKHFRGEYGAKLAVSELSTGRPILGHPGTAALVSNYLAKRSVLTESEKKARLEAIHPRRRSEPVVCSDCHHGDTRLVDFAAAGYPEARVRALSGPVVARMIEHINQGAPFKFPELMVPGGSDGARPSSRPASPTQEEPTTQSAN